MVESIGGCQQDAIRRSCRGLLIQPIGEQPFDVGPGVHALTSLDRRPCVRLERETHGFGRVVEPGLGGPGRDPQGGGRLLDGEVEIEAKDDDRPMIDGQALEAALEQVARGELGGGVGLRGLDAQDGDGRRLASAALELVVHVVDEEPTEPGIEAVGVAQAGQVAPAGDERLLDRVLGAIGVAQDEARHGEEPVDDARHDHVERLPVALGCSLHERSLHASLPPARPIVAALTPYCLVGVAKRFTGWSVSSDRDLAPAMRRPRRMTVGAR